MVVLLNKVYVFFFYIYCIYMYVYYGIMIMMYDSIVYLWFDLGVKYCVGYIVFFQEFYYKVVGGRLVIEYYGGDIVRRIFFYNF